MWGPFYFQNKQRLVFPNHEKVRYPCNVNALFSKKQCLLKISILMSVIPQISGRFPPGQSL